MRRALGFTLIETMIVVVIAGIILAFGMPAFVGYEQTLAKVQARARLIQDLRVARQIAVTQHHSVIMAFGTAPNTTNISTYTTLIDTNGNGLADNGERLISHSMPKGVLLTQVNLSPTDSLIFDPSGALRPGTTGGMLISTNGRGRADTLYISGVGMVYSR